MLQNVEVHTGTMIPTQETTNEYGILGIQWNPGESIRIAQTFKG